MSHFIGDWMSDLAILEEWLRTVEYKTATARLEKFKINQFNKLDHPAKPRWPLDDKAPFLKGAGVKL